MSENNRTKFLKEEKDFFLKKVTFPKRKKIELVEDRYTGTLYEMEVDDEDDDVCPVVRDYKNRDKK